jgi:transposase
VCASSLRSTAGRSAVTFVVALVASVARVWNWARPVPEDDRSSCSNRSIVTVGGVLARSRSRRPGRVRRAAWLAHRFRCRGAGRVEGTGAYGAGPARFLRARDLEVIEVDRPNRQLRRRAGKSETVDAVEAARAALSGRASGIVKSADGDVEAIRVLMVARRSARDVRIKYLNQIRHLGFTAPDELRERLRDVPADQLARTAASLRSAPSAGTVMHATKLTIRTLGRRVLDLEADAHDLDRRINELVRRAAPTLLDVHGVGTHTAAILLVAAGDNPDRLKRGPSALAARVVGP